MQRLAVQIEVKGAFKQVGEIVGTSSDDARFTYTESYLKDPESRAVSISMPLEQQSFSVESTRNFFEGLLPEGFTRRCVAEWLHRDEKDYLAILAGLGQECLGAIKIIDESRAVLPSKYKELTSEEVKKLATASIEEQPVEKRLDLLNGIIGADFADKVTMEQLNSEQRISIGLHPEVRHELEERQRQEQELFMQQETPMRQEYIQGSIGAAVDGRDLQLLNESKGWYREEKHGREVEVSDIAVQPAQTEGKYKMSAVIDGQVISHEISQKDYDKFLAVDDYHRMKLFSKIFNEVDMKTRPEANKGLGVKIFAALTAGAVVASEVAHGFHHHHSPEFYGERFSGPPHPYFKPGVDTPRDVAIRNFEAQMNQDINDMRRGR